jgi:hypothetical protein
MTTVIRLTLHRLAVEVDRLVGAVQATVGVTVRHRHQVIRAVAVEAVINPNLREMAVVIVILVIWLVWLWNFLGPV